LDWDGNEMSFLKVPAMKPVQEVQRYIKGAVCPDAIAEV